MAVKSSPSAHAAVVIGANHGTGAATAVAPASRGCSALFAFLRIDESAYRRAACRANRAQDAEAVVSQIRDAGVPAITGMSSSAAREAQEAVW